VHLDGWLPAAPMNTGQVSAAALSQTVITIDSGGAPSALNSSQLLLR